MSKTINSDIVVVGGGGSGLAAALQAAESGSDRVILLERRKSLGGNANFANGIFAAETVVQRQNMIDCDKDEIYRDVMKWNRYSTLVNPRILRKWINKTAETVDWLMEKGIEFEVGVRQRLHYHQNPCWHVVKGDGKLGRFNTALKIMREKAVTQGVEIIFDSNPRELLKENGKVCGLIAECGGEETKINASAVIMCTGGFMGNEQWLKKYFPYYDPEAFGGLIVPYRGEGIELVAEAGGALADSCTLVREACNTFAKDKGITPSVRQPFCIWINKSGQRFVGEDVAPHSQVASNALLRQPGALAWCLYDDSLINEVETKGFLLPHGPDCEFPFNFRQQLEDAAAENNDAVIKASSIEELAKQIGCPIHRLEKTIAENNRFYLEGYDEDFAKERRFLRIYEKAPYYAVKFSVLTVETIGPVIVDENMRVLQNSGNPIPGLYSAGVMTTGWMAEDYCGDYLFGANLSYSLTSGRIAAKDAVFYTTEGGSLHES